MKRWMHIFILFTLFFSKTFSFHLAPMFFEKRIDEKGGYQEFILFNNSTKTQRFKVQALPGSGEYLGDMNKWIEISPRVVTIKPKSQSILKTYIKSPKGVEEGEYSTFLNFKSIPIPDLNKNKISHINPTTNIGLSVSIEIIGYVGDLRANLEMSDLIISENNNNQGVISFNVQNNSFKRGVWYNVDIINNNESHESTEQGRVSVGKSDKVNITLKNMSKNEISKIRLRDSSTHETIFEKKL